MKEQTGVNTFTQQEDSERFPIHNSFAYILALYKTFSKLECLQTQITHLSTTSFDVNQLQELQDLILSLRSFLLFCSILDPKRLGRTLKTFFPFLQVFI